MKLKAGAALGPYRIVEELGRGGMGAVYRAYQPSLDRFVAIKVLPAFFAEDERLRARFKREAVTIAQLDHPAILPVYEYGEKGLRPYIVMALAEGGTLAALAEGPMSVDAAVRLLIPLADALDYAHQRGVLHRDVKPANILLRRDGRPLLSDFGLARSGTTETRLTESSAALGTPDYMAPELWRGQPATPASDQYSLAILTHELLTGRLPFPVSTLGSIGVPNVSRPPELALAPPEAQPALKRALAKSPKDRFANCSEFVKALQPEAVAPPAKRRSLLVGGVVAAVVLLAGGAALANNAGQHPTTRAHTASPTAQLGKGPLKVTVLGGLTELKSPGAMAVAPDGSLYIVDKGNNLVRKVDPNGVASIFAGGGTLGILAGLTTPATSVALHSPSGVAVDGDGNVYVSDTGSNRVVVIDPGGGLRLFAGNGNAGRSGDEGPATSAELSAPSGLSYESAGDPAGRSLWIVDEGNNTIRKVVGDGTMTTPNFLTLKGTPLDPKLDLSGGMAWKPINPGVSLFFSSTRGNQVFKWNYSCAGLGDIAMSAICFAPVAGTGVAGFAGDGGDAAQTTLNHPGGLAETLAQDLYIADTGNNRIRFRDHSGTITTVIGGGTNPNATKPTEIQLNAPEAVVLSLSGVLYVADTGNNRILRIAP